ncbi:MAG: IS66 family insertion sequence element accessory protein TnpA [Flavobacteriales bacterium]|jgi:hypothetical protein
MIFVLACGHEKELTWEQHIELCLQSGLSKKTYCEEYNLCYPLFFYIQRNKIYCGLLWNEMDILHLLQRSEVVNFFYRRGTEGAKLRNEGTRNSQ